MITFVPYQPEHLAQIELQPAQQRWRERFAVPGYAEAIAVPGLCWTALDGDRVLGCGGLQPQWEGRALAWLVVGAVSRTAWPRIVGRVRQTLREAAFRRVEMHVAQGFGNGCRLAAILSFTVEGLMRGFAPDGGDYYLYARVA
jgi:hypothetical protein